KGVRPSRKFTAPSTATASGSSNGTTLLWVDAPAGNVIDSPAVDRCGSVTRPAVNSLGTTRENGVHAAHSRPGSRRRGRDGGEALAFPRGGSSCRHGRRRARLRRRTTPTVSRCPTPLLGVRGG